MNAYNKPYVNKAKLALAIIFLIIFIIGCVGVYFLNPVYNDMREVYFFDLNNNRMIGSYVKGTRDGVGVLLVCDKGMNMSYYMNMASALQQQGYSVMIFDLPGQGRSQGSYTTTFYEDNTAAMQVFSAMLAFSQLCRLSSDSIHVVGHGFGARAVLQAVSVGYMKDEENFSSSLPGSLTLIDPELKYTDSVLARLPVFVNDSELEWVQTLNQTVTGLDILLVTNSTNDFNTQSLTNALQSNNRLTTISLNRPITQYAPLAPSTISQTTAYLNNLNGLTTTETANLNMTHNIILAAVIVCAFLAVFFAYGAYKRPLGTFEQYTQKLNAKFYLYKLLFWVPAAAIGLTLFLSIYFLPPSYPALSAFVSFMFGAYGVVMLFIYKYTNFANDAGANMFQDKARTTWFSGFIVSILAFFMIKYVGNLGLYYTFALSERWLWLIILGVLNSVAFLIIDREFATLDANRFSKIKIVGVVCLPFILFALTIFTAGYMALALDSLIAVAGLLFVVLLGRVLEALNTKIALSAIFQGLLYTMFLLSFGFMIS